VPERREEKSTGNFDDSKQGEKEGFVFGELYRGNHLLSRDS